MTDRTWEISDLDGGNKRTVTLAQYRAEIDAAKAKAIAIHNANVAKADKKARTYTHSAWSGRKYDRPQTQAELIAESMAVLRRHPTIGKTL